MIEKEIERIINLHKMVNKLKTTLRSGWLNCKVMADRIESVAEHIFGTCMLAIGIYSTTKKDIDIDKVVTMLMLHETEEIYIGDLTPLDYKGLKTKKEKGHKAVLKVFGGFKYADHFLEIIEEFEAGETAEAKFAYQCDKLEACLQADIYCNNFDFAHADARVSQDEKIKSLIEQGFDTVPEIFLQNCKTKFTDEFLQIANYMEKQQKFNKSKLNGEKK